MFNTSSLSDSSVHKIDSDSLPEGILVHVKSKKIQKKVFKLLKKRGWKLSKKSKNVRLSNWNHNEKIKRQRILEECANLKKLFLDAISCDANLPFSLEENKPHANTKSAIESEKADDLNEACQLLEEYEGMGNIENYPPLKGKLSVLWAEEYVGSDLAIELYEEIGSSDAKLHKTQIAVADSIDEDPFSHGNRVCAAISRVSSGSSRLCTKSESNRLEFFPLGGQKSIHYNSELIDILDKKDADIFSLSLGDLGKPVYEAFKEYHSKNNTLVVMSAGNAADGRESRKEATYSGLANLNSNNGESMDSFDRGLYDPRKNRFQNGILVGSLSPHGLMSNFSSSYGNVTIAAPSDDFLTTINPGDFAGTSGAAPVVSGALSHLKSLLPKLNSPEAKSILSVTALPTANSFYTPRHHGAGTLNSYGALFLAKQIRNKCGVRYTESCFKREVELFRKTRQAIPERVRENLDNSRSLFGCGGDTFAPQGEAKEVNGTCIEKKESFKRLRKLAYLYPDHGPLWSALSCIHNRIGFSANAKFYENLARLNPVPSPDPDSRDKVLKEIIIDGGALNNIYFTDMTFDELLESDVDKHSRSFVLTAAVYDQLEGGVNLEFFSGNWKRYLYGHPLQEFTLEMLESIASRGHLLPADAIVSYAKNPVAMGSFRPEAHLRRIIARAYKNGQNSILENLLEAYEGGGGPFFEKDEMFKILKEVSKENSDDPELLKLLLSMFTDTYSEHYYSLSSAVREFKDVSPDVLFDLLDKVPLKARKHIASLFSWYYRTQESSIEFTDVFSRLSTSDKETQEELIESLAFFPGNDAVPYNLVFNSYSEVSPENHEKLRRIVERNIEKGHELPVGSFMDLFITTESQEHRKMVPIIKELARKGNQDAIDAIPALFMVSEFLPYGLVKDIEGISPGDLLSYYKSIPSRNLSDYFSSFRYLREAGHEIPLDEMMKWFGELPADSKSRLKLSDTIVSGLKNGQIIPSGAGEAVFLNAEYNKAVSSPLPEARVLSALIESGYKIDLDSVIEAAEKDNTSHVKKRDAILILAKASIAGQKEANSFLEKIDLKDHDGIVIHYVEKALSQM